MPAPALRRSPRRPRRSSDDIRTTALGSANASSDIPAHSRTGRSPRRSGAPLDARCRRADDHAACATTSRPAPSPSSSPTSRARRSSCTRSVPRRTRRHSPSTAELTREACAAEGGVEVDTQGDAFFFAFPTAPGALAAAAALTEALAPGPIHVRVGLHTGTPLVTDEGYVGDDVHRAARIAAVGHGGQVLVAASTAALVGLDGLARPRRASLQGPRCARARLPARRAGISPAEEPLPLKPPNRGQPSRRPQEGARGRPASAARRLPRGDDHRAGRRRQDALRARGRE